VINGILFGGVVVLWAAFLVPWALRRYDESTRNRPIDTFSDAVRVLRRSDEGDGAAIASRPRLDAGDFSGAHVHRPRPSRAAARAAAARRRLVLFVLLGVTVVVAVLAAVAVLPVWAVVIPVALVVTWLVLCRFQVRSEDAAAWTRRRSEVVASLDPADDEETVRIVTTATATSANPVTPRTVQPPAADEAADDETVVEQPAGRVCDDDLVEETADAVPVNTSDGGSLWDPLPVTLPTYVTKPKANRSIRTIDLEAPDTWTSGHVEGERTTMPAQQAAEDHRRAVGN
jgi:hypothetical protein